MSLSRRGYLRMAATAGWLIRTGLANPLGKPIGLQLYMLEAELGKDFAGTLGKVAEIGIREVEIAALYGKTAAQWKSALKTAGLRCRSVHVYDTTQPVEEVMRFAADLGAEYVVTSLNAPAEILAKIHGKPEWQPLVHAVEQMTLEDWKKSAEIANELGKHAATYGLKYAYHNHNVEFRKFAGITAFETLLANTDAARVRFEMDCGWVAAAGYQPASFLERFPERIRLLHIKAFQNAPANFNLAGPLEPKSAEIGHGQPNYPAVFAAAAKAQVEQYYIEQEPPFTRMTALEAVEASYRYLHAMA